MSDEEHRIIQMKYASVQIGRMNDREISKWQKALLLKIHIITGWVIPSSELLNILIDQFGKKLIEDYSMLNTEEIEFAFRKTGTTTKDWGKEMNLNLIDQVLVPYLHQRLNASAAEEKKKEGKEVQKIYTDEEILNKRRGDIETAYQAMRCGRFPIVFDYFSEVLQFDGFIETLSEIDQFFVDSLNNQRERIYVYETKL